MATLHILRSFEGQALSTMDAGEVLTPDEPRLNCLRQQRRAQAWPDVGFNSNNKRSRLQIAANLAAADKLAVFGGASSSGADRSAG